MNTSNSNQKKLVIGCWVFLLSSSPHPSKVEVERQLVNAWNADTFLTAAGLVGTVHVLVALQEFLGRFPLHGAECRLAADVSDVLLRGLGLVLLELVYHETEAYEHQHAKGGVDRADRTAFHCVGVGLSLYLEVVCSRGLSHCWEGRETHTFLRRFP